MNQDNPEPFSYAAVCYWHTGRVDAALMMLDASYKIAIRDKKSYGQLLNQLDLYKKAWSNKKQPTPRDV